MFHAQIAAALLTATCAAGAVSTSDPVVVHGHGVAYERVTVNPGRCVTGVSVYAESADGSDTVMSRVDHSVGSRHVIRLRFDRANQAGRWFVVDVFYRNCGSPRVRDLIGSVYPAFTVRHVR